MGTGRSHKPEAHAKPAFTSDNGTVPLQCNAHIDIIN